ncbi:MAG: transposase [Chloroflexota bacterium]
METDLFYRRLPHWHPANAMYFVTFRLEGSLSQETIETLRREREEAEQRLKQEFQGKALAEEKYKTFKKMFTRYDDLLATSEGIRWLADEPVAKIIRDEIHALHPGTYHLIAYCIMPNHVHLLIDLQDTPEPAPLKEGQHYTALSHAMKLLKGRTGHACRKLVGGSGPFWQHESYDHVVRNHHEFENIISYILNNPVKAGLVKDWQEWPYSFVENT